ncbi:hypothetical protein NARC_110032 [Candidatus Nitrosocosmicus arcticus]|uniref:Uncharacterized protein n=1 Tax=Candidatus Nitrosocosmicus arcticus TaxID=2035267 RepID=A0A557ST84_9ARCH|nr:hypothetical protein NARC_110032 [Candidatus Nitrosocosmicus arcticus]
MFGSSSSGVLKYVCMVGQSILVHKNTWHNLPEDLSLRLISAKLISLNMIYIY